MSTVLTLFHMTPQGGSATLFNGAHHPTLLTAQRAGVLLAIGPSIAAQDISEFQGRTHEWLRLCVEERGQQVQGTGSGAYRGGRYMGIGGGGDKAAVAKQQLDGAHVRAGFQ